MKYTVVWLASAERELAAIWNQAVDKQAVADAADQIDRELARDANKKGTPIDNDRALTVSPLSVMFSISQPDCLVTVLQVNRTN